MKKIIAIIALSLTFGNAFAAGKVLPSIGNQSPQVMGGADSSNNIVPFRLDADGNILVVEDFGSITARRINISANGATDRTQGPDVAVHSCTFAALAANVGVVYAGGSTVTNASGAAPGFPLSAGAGLGSVTMSNLNQIYFATDTANDDIAAFCN